MEAICPHCKSKVTDALTSINKIFCAECNKFYPFPLKKGKKSILIKGLVGK